MLEDGLRGVKGNESSDGWVGWKEGRKRAPRAEAINASRSRLGRHGGRGGADRVQRTFWIWNMDASCGLTYFLASSAAVQRRKATTCDDGHSECSACGVQSMRGLTLECSDLRCSGIQTKV